MYINFRYIEFKNFLSYGNNLNRVNFESGLNLISAKNGSGKCVDKLTNIDIIIESDDVLKKFKEFIKNK